MCERILEELFMKIEKIEEYSKNGIKTGDNCESCETEKKPVFHLENTKLGIDIILCPKCIDKLKKEVNDIPV